MSPLQPIIYKMTCWCLSLFNKYSQNHDRVFFITELDTHLIQKAGKQKEDWEEGKAAAGLVAAPYQHQQQ